MELRDFIVTPIVIAIVYFVAYLVRPYFTDEINRKYFLPALSVRIIGALAVGFIYQFYYHGGDTFSYHTHGSRLVWQAFMDSPEKGLSLIFSNREYEPSTFKYSSQIWFFEDSQSYFVVRILSVVDLITFSSYSASAVVFSVISFIGAWALFVTFYRMYRDIHRWIAFSCLFVPTVFFWGSGIFKDTLTMAALGMATYACYKLFFVNKNLVRNAVVILVSFWITYSVKKYILLSFLPAVILWVFVRYFSRMKPIVLRLLLVPFVVTSVIVLGYLTMLQVAEDDPRYNVSKLAETAKITAYDIRYGWGARGGEGSGYTLGELDGSWQSMIRLAPAAINVSLFRPYIWEVRNPLMLLSALEGLLCLMLTLYVLYKSGGELVRHGIQADVLFCLSFSLIFAFAVGVSTFNFGTLSRYKIPLMPYYLLGIGILYYSSYVIKIKKVEGRQTAEINEFS